MLDDVGLRVEQRGDGPDVLLTAGLGDTTEAWELQLAAMSDRYRVTAYDARGICRSPLRHHELNVEAMAGDAATVLDQLDTDTRTRRRRSRRRSPKHSPSATQRVRSLVLVSTWGRQ